MNGKRVLVTGGTGFIGSFLVEALLARGARVRVPLRAQNYRHLSARRKEIEWLEGDLRDGDYCARLLRDIDEVFHLASCRRNVAVHRGKCADVLRENLRMTLGLLDGLRERGGEFPPVTFFSSANVPPSLDVIALAQENDTDGYVLGKALCETLWFAASRQHRFPLLILRPVGVYGPRDTFSLDGNVVPSLCLKARDSTDAMVVWGSGAQERAFLYVEDLVAAALQLRDVGAHGIQYVHAPEVVKVRVLAQMIRDHVHPGLPIRYDRTRPEGPRAMPLLPLHSCLQHFHWTPLREGLLRTIADWQKCPSPLVACVASSSTPSPAVTVRNF